MGFVITGQRLLGRGMPVAVSVEQEHDLGEVSKLAAAAADAQGFDQTLQEQVGLVATDMAEDVLREAGSGRIFVRLVERGDLVGVELVASGHGPGAAATRTRGASDGRTVVEDVESLGAKARACDLFDVYAVAGHGTVTMARFWGAKPPFGGDGRFLVGSMMEPIAGEEVCGDAWAVEQSAGRVVALIADGLGHGVDAAAASSAAVNAFRLRYREPVENIVGHVHAALRRTRGASIGVAEIDLDVGRLRFCGVGNIAARLIVGGVERNLISRFGIAGYQTPKIRAYDEVWEDGALLVMHSDGLSSSWELRRYPDLVGHHPQLVAATVMRDAGRGNDDRLVLALRDAPEATRDKIVLAL